MRPSKLVTCLNDDGCFEGVPSLATVLASFEAWGIVNMNIQKGGVSLLKGSHRYAQF